MRISAYREKDLWAKASDTVYPGFFIASRPQRLLHYDSPPRVFAACYTGFGVLAALSCYYVRPRPFDDRLRRSGRGRR